MFAVGGDVAHVRTQCLKLTRFSTRRVVANQETQQEDLAVFRSCHAAALHQCGVSCSSYGPRWRCVVFVYVTKSGSEAEQRDTQGVQRWWGMLHSLFQRDYLNWTLWADGGGDSVDNSQIDADSSGLERDGEFRPLDSQYKRNGQPHM